MMINNRKTMQKIVATIAILGVAASGAITFLSVAATQPPTTVTNVNENLQTSNNVQLPEETVPVTPESVDGSISTEPQPSE